MTDKTKPLRCRLGWHKFDSREIHMLEPIFDGQIVAKMAVLERCKCGEARFAWNGNSMPTKLVCPTKYMPAKDTLCPHYKKPYCLAHSAAGLYSLNWRT